MLFSSSDTYDITELVVEVRDDQICLHCKKVPGNTLYAAYIEIHNKSDVVMHTVVPRDMNEICLSGLNPGEYAVKYCELNVSPTPATPNVSLANTKELIVPSTPGMGEVIFTSSSAFIMCHFCKLFSFNNFDSIQFV